MGDGDRSSGAGRRSEGGRDEQVRDRGGLARAVGAAGCMWRFATRDADDFVAWVLHDG